MVDLGARPDRLAAAIGPCIRQDGYEVDAPLRDRVLARSPTAAGLFAPGARPSRWQFDLPGYVAALLRTQGPFRIDDLGLDTVQHETIYFSHRRSKQRDEVRYGVQLSGIRVPG
jgi:hypothetical protein